MASAKQSPLLDAWRVGHCNRSSPSQLLVLCIPWWFVWREHCCCLRETKAPPHPAGLCQANLQPPGPSGRCH